MEKPRGARTKNLRVDGVPFGLRTYYRLIFFGFDVFETFEETGCFVFTT